MADGFVWLRCRHCKGVIRFITYSYVYGWGLWNGEPLLDFINAHARCAPENPDASVEGGRFFDLVTEKEAYADGNVNAARDRAWDQALGGLSGGDVDGGQ